MGGWAGSDQVRTEQASMDRASVVSLYRGVLEEYGRMDSERSNTDNVYRSLAVLLLGAEAYIVLNSQFSNWISVVVAAGIALFGLVFTAAWRSALKQSTILMQFHFHYLKRMESRKELAALGADLCTIFDAWAEHREIEGATLPRPVSRTNYLNLRYLTPRLFAVGYVALAGFVAALTALATIPALHGYILPLVPTP
jgi:hypothetical protein